MARFSPIGRPALLALGAAAVYIVASAPALADTSCADTLKKLSDQRAVELTAINTLGAEAKKKKKAIDPAVFCTKAHALNHVEDALLSYMQTNKDWCGIPDPVLANLKDSHSKSVAFAQKACVAAARYKKMKEQAAAGGGPQAQPLPAGPL